jgi:hypothetical protein
MATTTTYYGWTKPGTLDRADISVLDNIFDQQDATFHTWSGQIASVVNRVIYNYTSSAYPARPSGAAAGFVEYIGPVTPTDWVDGDTWVDNS